MAKKASNIFDNVTGLIVGIPIILIVMVLIVPGIIYYLGFKLPYDSFKKRQFLKRNYGKIILCITNSTKYNALKKYYESKLHEIGIDDIVEFDGVKPNNIYDNYEWDILICRAKGFPILIFFAGKELIQLPMKSDFCSFFKKEIDLDVLIDILKFNITQTINELG
ncbi:MAG: hypothetical protein AAF149_09450 [Bacteroidota bacterium]